MNEVGTISNCIKSQPMNRHLLNSCVMKHEKDTSAAYWSTMVLLRKSTGVGFIWVAS